MINTALAYLKAGLSVVPAISKEKYTPSGFKWQKYQKELMTNDQAFSFFSAKYPISHNNKKEISVDGIAIICGEISGGLEVIDFDNKFGDIKQIFSRFCKIPEIVPIIDGMVAEKTQSGGYHLAYRCDKIEGSKKIAQRLPPEAKKPIAIIESRGEGGLIIAAPSIGYELIGKSNFDNVKRITPEERDILWQHLYSFNEYIRPDEQYHHEMFNSNTDRPGDQYNKDISSYDECRSLLSVAGWKTFNGIHYTRPGKKKGVSATFGKVAPGVFYCFSSNGHPFEDRKGYKPFQLFSILAHNGNFEEAAKELASERGYGKQDNNPAYTELAKQVHLANKKGVTAKEAAAAIESNLPEKEVRELTDKIYKQNEEEHGFDKKTAIEKAEIFLRKNYEFRRNTVTLIVEMDRGHGWEDMNPDTIYRDLQYNYIKFGMDNIKSLMKSDFVENYDPFVEYFEGLPDYSGENYFAEFAKYIAVDDKEFFATMLRKHFVRAIRCALNPDYYNRIVLTFLSTNQEIGKSYLINWFNPFGSQYYTDEFLKDNKDSLFALAENFIYNLEELDTLSRMELGKLKATISKRGIKDRPAYAHQKIFMPRRCTFFGSTNREEFLVDDSNTRWLVFRADKVDWAYSKKMDVNDLWAEAWAFYNDKDYNCELSADEKKWRDKENEKYQVNEVERSLIIKHFESSEDTDEYMTNADILMTLSDVSQGKIKMIPNPQKVGRILSSLGFKPGQRQVNNKNCRVYFVRQKFYGTDKIEEEPPF